MPTATDEPNIPNKKESAVTDDGTEELTGEKEEISRQEIVALGIASRERADNIEFCEHVMKALARGAQGPNLWGREDFKTIRECVGAIASRPDLYHPLMGDKLPDVTLPGEQENDGGGGHGRKNPSLTTNYISSIAEYKDLDAKLPILQVVSTPNMDFEEFSRKGKSTNIHFTHLRLCDGSNDVMTGRLSMHLAHEGNKLEEGDIIQLNRFTALTYQSSGTDKPYRSPAVVIHIYSRVGSAAVPKKLESPKHCNPMTAEEMEANNKHVSGDTVQSSDGAEEKEGYERLVEVECTPEHRYCSVYGLNPVLCVCVSDPVKKVDMEVLRQYCYFATMDVTQMEPTSKRNMLYWWYMTNTYNICGKGNRQKPPACLLAAIRKEFREDDGWYKIFVAGKKPTHKRAKK